jgi:hypothetical protein
MSWVDERLPRPPEFVVGAGRVGEHVAQKLRALRAVSGMTGHRDALLAQPPLP